jgi:hypothetical protein
MRPRNLAAIRGENVRIGRPMGSIPPRVMLKSDAISSQERWNAKYPKHSSNVRVITASPIRQREAFACYSRESTGCKHIVMKRMSNEPVKTPTWRV